MTRETHVTKNMETPMGPRSANTPAAGKMIIPSVMVQRVRWGSVNRVRWGERVGGKRMG
jgi:hypothetical protein